MGYHCRPRSSVVASSRSGSSGRDVYTHTHTGNPLACAAALVVLEEVPMLLDRVTEAGERFERAGWQGVGLMRARRATRTRRSPEA